MARAINLGGDVGRLALPAHPESCECGDCTQAVRDAAAEEAMRLLHAGALEQRPVHYEYHDGPPLAPWNGGTLPLQVMASGIAHPGQLVWGQHDDSVPAMLTPGEVVLNTAPFASLAVQMSELVPDWTPVGKNTDIAQARLSVLGLHSHLVHMPGNSQGLQRARLLIEDPDAKLLSSETWLLLLDANGIAVTGCISATTAIAPLAPEDGFSGIDMTSIGDSYRKVVRK